MYRKIALLSLVGLFLAFTVGVPLHKHYCGTKLFSAGIIKKDCCCENTPAKPDDCCSSESAYFNIDQDFEASSPVKVKLDVPKVSLIPVFTIPEQSIASELADSSVVQEEEPIGNIPLYKLLQEFIIYG